MLTRIQLICYAFILSAVGVQGTHAAILISNIEFGDFSKENPNIAGSLTFDLVGTIKDVVGKDGKNILVIAEMGKTSWVLDSSSGTWTSDQTMSLPELVTVSAGALNGGNEGDRVYVALNGGNQTAPAFVYQQFISGTLSIQGGEFDISATDTTEWKVAVGFNDFIFPDPTTITGSAAPEPTSMAILSLGALWLLSRRRCQPSTAS